MSQTIYPSTQSNIPESWNLQQHHSENVRSCSLHLNSAKPEVYLDNDHLKNYFTTSE